MNGIPMAKNRIGGRDTTYLHRIAIRFGRYDPIRLAPPTGWKPLRHSDLLAVSLRRIAPSTANP